MRNNLLIVSIVSLLSVLALGACGYNPDLGGGAPFLCGTDEPKCPDGYECKPDTMGVMACHSTSGNVIDAAVSGFQCADDSILEGATKNDTIATAYSTPVASSKPDITFAGLAICPEGDKDTYKMDVSVLSDIEVITTWDAGMPVSVSILGSGGATLANGTSSGEKSLKAFAANLPAGTYYAQAYASATAKNNYKISLKVTPK
ncbi:MAG: hypothetical protein ABI175_24975 [Polyangiales bacterium]